MIIATTIGRKLSKQEIRQVRTAKRQERMNTMVVWIAIGMFGLGLGYGWRMWHESQQWVVDSQEWQNGIKQEQVDLIHIGKLDSLDSLVYVKNIKRMNGLKEKEL